MGWDEGWEKKEGGKMKGRGEKAQMRGGGGGAGGGGGGRIDTEITRYS